MGQLCSYFQKCLGSGTKIRKGGSLKFCNVLFKSQTVNFTPRTNLFIDHYTWGNWWTTLAWLCDWWKIKDSVGNFFPFFWKLESSLTYQWVLIYRLNVFYKTKTDSQELSLGVSPMLACTQSMQYYSFCFTALGKYVPFEVPKYAPSVYLILWNCCIHIQWNT